MGRGAISKRLFEGRSRIVCSGRFLAPFSLTQIVSVLRSLSHPWPGQSGKLVMVVRDDGVIVPKPVETGPLEDHAMRVITHGLLPTDRVVVQGLMRVRPGMKVEPHLQTADANTKG